MLGRQAPLGQRGGRFTWHRPFRVLAAFFVLGGISGSRAAAQRGPNAPPIARPGEALKDFPALGAYFAAVQKEFAATQEELRRVEREIQSTAEGLGDLVGSYIEDSTGRSESLTYRDQIQISGVDDIACGVGRERDRNRGPKVTKADIEDALCLAVTGIKQDISGNVAEFRQATEHLARSGTEESHRIAVASLETRLHGSRLLAIRDLWNAHVGATSLRIGSLIAATEQHQVDMSRRFGREDSALYKNYGLVGGSMLSGDARAQNEKLYAADRAKLSDQYDGADLGYAEGLLPRLQAIADALDEKRGRLMAELKRESSRGFVANPSSPNAHWFSLIRESLTQLVYRGPARFTLGPSTSEGKYASRLPSDATASFPAVKVSRADSSVPYVTIEVDLNARKAVNGVAQGRNASEKP